MKRITLIVLLLLIVPSFAGSTEGNRKHVFVCRSPILAFDFWRALQDKQRQGVTLTPKIVQEICDGMKAGRDRQCIRVEADEFKPVASGWGGALALTDGRTIVRFGFTTLTQVVGCIQIITSPLSIRNRIPA
jgi:hypothetical protein